MPIGLAQYVIAHSGFLISRMDRARLSVSSGDSESAKWVALIDSFLSFGPIGQKAPGNSTGLFAFAQTSILGKFERSVA